MAFDPLLEQLRVIKNDLEWDVREARENIHDLQVQVIQLIEVLEALTQRK